MAEKIGLEAVLQLNSFSSAVRQYQSAISGMSKNTISVASSISSSFANLGSTILKVGAIATGAGFAGLAVGLGAVVSTGISFNNTMEQSAAKINAFTKDAGLTAKILEDVRKEAALTPFEFDAMANAVSGLLPAAKQADVAIMDLLKDAEVLAASNPAEGLEGAAFALREAVSGDFTSVIERFNLPRTAINKLKDEGVPALEIVRQVMKDMGYDMDLVSALANTAQGRWSTLKDTFTNLAGAITQPIFTQFSSGLGSINDLLTANEPKLTAFANLLAGKVSEAITTITAKAMQLSTAFAVGGTGGLLTALGIGPDGIALFGKVSTLITDVSTAISTVLLPALQNLSGSGAMEAINRGLAFINEHFIELQGALLGIGAVIGTGVLVALASAIAGLITPITLLIAAGALLGAAWAGNWGNIQGVVGSAIAYITTQFSTLMGLLQPSIASLQDSFTRLSATFAQTGIDSSTLTNILSGMGSFIVGVLIPAWVQWIGFLAGAAAKTISLWVTYIQTVYGAWQVLSGFIQSDVVPALLKVNEGITIINTVLASFGGLVSAVVNKALQAMAGLFQNVLLPALIKIGDAFNKVLFPVFQSIGKTTSEELSPALRTLGEEIFPLLQEGLDFVTEAIKTTIGYFNSLKNTVESFTLPDILTPGSPPPMAVAMMDIANSTNAANEAVKGMMDSLAASKWDTIRSEVFDVIDDMQDAGHYAAMGFGQTTGEHIKRVFKQAFTQSFQGIISGTVTGKDLENLTKHLAGAYAERVSGNFDKIVSQARQASLSMIREMQDELLSALPSIAGNLSGLAGQFGEFLKPEMDARASMIKRLQDFTKNPQGGVFRFDWKERLVGVDHVMMNQIQAQSQLNLLLREQAAQEKLITEQKEAQQKLSFLQAQVDLIKIGKELGGNIFQGMTFGLHASTEDLLKATNAVVSAMVEQINTTLQIASPSKVMARIGGQVIAGMAMGIERGRNMLTDTVRNIPLLNGSIPQPVFSQAGGISSATNNTYNYNMPMTVNTTASASGVMRAYEVKRSMYAN